MNSSPEINSSVARNNKLFHETFWDFSTQKVKELEKILHDLSLLPIQPLKKPIKNILEKVEALYETLRSFQHNEELQTSDFSEEYIHIKDFFFPKAGESESSSEFHKRLLGNECALNLKLFQTIKNMENLETLLSSGEFVTKSDRSVRYLFCLMMKKSLLQLKEMTNPSLSKT